MGLVIAFVLFIGSMILMLITGHSMVWALLVGLLLFTGLGLKQLDMPAGKGIRVLASNKE